MLVSFAEKKVKAVLFFVRIVERIRTMVQIHRNSFQHLNRLI